MTYVLSDLHGDHERYLQMLDAIKLDEDRDVLYVLGDVLDFGEGSMQILLDMSSRPNVYPIIGEHEYTALPLLKAFAEKLASGDVASMAAEPAFVEWGKMGGQATLREFMQLSTDDRDWIIEYLEEFAPYEEVEVGGKEYLLVHAGLANFSKDRDLDDYGIKELVEGEVDYQKIYFPDRILVTGHKPTVEINPAYKGKIFSLNNHIAVDCGAAYGLPLGCLRLEDGKEFYID